MATFTTIPKQKISWEAPPDAPRAGDDSYELLIGSGFFLEIGNGYKLTVTPQIPVTQYANTPRSKITAGGTPAVKTDFFLNIGDGFTLLVDDTHKLVTNPSQPETPWTTLTKS